MKQTIKNTLILFSILIFLTGGAIWLYAQNSTSKVIVNNSVSSQTSISSSETTASTSVVASSTTTSKQLTVVPNDTCGLTKSATEGPYYVSGTGEVNQGEVNYTELPGEIIKIFGYVYSGETGNIPIANAKIEIWHADEAGSYKPNGNGPVTKYTAEQLALRGYVVSGTNGYYEFNSINPGHYQGRTRHIHIKVSTDTKSITTQLITPPKASDSDQPSTDPIAKNLPACNKIEYTNYNGVLTSSFNFRL
jgi:protocatechuate 3,4-dioxygenase beta subunit